MKVVTVRGSHGGPGQTIVFPSSEALKLGKSMAKSINKNIHEKLSVITTAGTYTVSSAAIVSNAPGATTIYGHGNQQIIGGSGGLTFSSAANSKDKIALAGGDNSLVFATGSSANVATGQGNDYIYANGNATINAGEGANTIAAALNARTTAHIKSIGTGDVIETGAGSATVTATGSNDAIYGGSTGSQVVIDEGVSNAMFGGSGAETIYGGSQSLVFLSYGTTEFIGSTKSDGSDTLYGQGNGSETVFGGRSDLVVANSSSLLFIGDNGSATINGGAGNDTLFGNAGSFLNYYGSSGTALLIAGTGNATLSASAATAGVKFDAGSGNALLIGGSGNDTFLASTGNNTMTGGAGANKFTFDDGSTGGADLITDFKQGSSGTVDTVYLSGYGPNEVQNALQSAVTSGGNTTITLADHTKIEFLGVTQLNPNNFVGT